MERCHTFNLYGIYDRVACDVLDNLREFGILETAYSVLQRRSARAKNENIKRRQELSSHKEKF